MQKKYGIKNKSSKQCRERWVNSLCPNINKGTWSEKEEKILFLTQLKIGNKWSELAKLLPGRSENDIKNHFYSKLRKYIRKMCKKLHKSKLLEAKGINSNMYSATKVYSLIQVKNVPLVSLSLRTIINVILNDYLDKQERLNLLQESAFNEEKLNYNRNFEFLRNKRNLNSNKRNKYFEDYSNEVDNNNENEEISRFFNKKKDGINIFEELLNDD